MLFYEYENSNITYLKVIFISELDILFLPASFIRSQFEAA